MMQGTITIPILRKDVQIADLILEFGVGTDNPSFELVNHMRDGITIGEIKRELTEDAPEP